MGEGDVKDEFMAVPDPGAVTHAAPVGEVVRCGRGHPFALGEAGQDLHGARAADADLNHYDAVRLPAMT